MNSGETEVARRPFLTPTAVAHIAFVPTGIMTVLLGPVLPSLAARWSLNDAQAGELFTAQFLASTVGVALSGVLVPRLGYRLVLVLGLAFMALGVGTLPLGSWALGMSSVFGPRTLSRNSDMPSGPARLPTNRRTRTWAL